MRRGLAPRISVLHYVASHRVRCRGQRPKVSVKAGEGPVSAPGGPAPTSLWGSGVLLVIVPLVYSVLTSTWT